MLITPVGFLRRIARWPAGSQQQFCRNALAASPALAARRQELVEVDELLSARAGDLRHVGSGEMPHYGTLSACPPPRPSSSVSGSMA